MFTHDLLPRFNDTDALGHINNSSLTIIVHFDYTENKSLRVPDHMRDQLTPHVGRE